MSRSTCHNNGRARRTVRSVRLMNAAVRGAAFPTAHASVYARAGDRCPGATNSTETSRHGAIRSTHGNGWSAVLTRILFREFPRCAVLGARRGRTTFVARLWLTTRKGRSDHGTPRRHRSDGAPDAAGGIRRRPRRTRGARRQGLRGDGRGTAAPRDAASGRSLYACCAISRRRCCPAASRRWATSTGCTTW